MEAGKSRDESTFLVALWKFRAKYTPAVACKCTESRTSVTNSLLLRLELTQVRICSFVLFLPHSVVFCVSVKKYVMLLIGNHWMNHWSWVVWFKEAEIVGVGRRGVLSQYLKEPETTYPGLPNRIFRRIILRIRLVKPRKVVSGFFF